MPNIDLETLLKHYTEGRISKKEFVYLHSLISQSKQILPKKPAPSRQLQNKQPQNKPPQYKQPQYNQPQVNAQAIAPNELDAPPGMWHFFKSRYKSVAAFMGSLWIFATLALNYFNGASLPFMADNRNHSQIVQQTPISTSSKPREIVKKDVKDMAESLTLEPIWEAHSVNEFTTQWITLSAHKKDIIRNTPWFEKFIDAFKKQVKFELARRIDGGSTTEIENRQRALTHLAVSLNLVRTSPTSLADLEKSLFPAEIQRPKTKADPPQAKKPVKTAVAQERTVKKSVVSTEPKTKAAPQAKRGAINGREIVEVIDQYIAAFEKGSSQQILTLFADDSVLQRPMTLKTVRTQYSDLFRHSTERWVEFRGLTWEQKGQESRGKGKLRTSLRVLPGGDYKTVTTDVMIAMRKIDNVTRITDFELGDSSIFALAIPLEQNNATKKLATKDRPKYPTQSELQDVVTQYVDSYQSGDIRRIMELYASSTWTADPSGLEELRNEYMDLFQSTTDRQVFISNMDWSFKGNKAMGTGDLVINLLSKQDHAITTKKGKVRLIVEKNLQKARISHLFQIIN
jgi:ketosteroid isomerase-like protein